MIHKFWEIAYWLAKPIPGPLINLIARPISRPFIHNTRRSRVLLLCGSKILLIQTRIGLPGWKLPGGGLKRKEPEAIGATREIKEEVNIDLDPEKLRYLFEQPIQRDRFKYTVVVFSVEVPSETMQIDGLEITKGQWFELNSLPEDRHAIVDTAIAAHKSLEESEY